MLYILMLQNSLSGVDKLSESSMGFSHRHREGLLSAVSAGFFLVLAGMLFATTPDLFQEFIDFFNGGFPWVRIPNTDIWLFAPTNPGGYTVIYQAVQQFCLIWGIFLVAMLVARFVIHSPSRRKAENVGDMFFWLGAAYVVQTMLLDKRPTYTEWFAFWAEILMLLGVSLIARAIFLAATRKG